ncbi:MAG: hypothetical protein KJ732_02910 [Candidatus Margulisbacteria bacterium]|nr:hypothetical protein [Candidatus Margulisiibacteriota bacterium]
MVKKVLLPGLVAGVVLLIVGMGWSFLLNAIFPGLAAEYQNTALFRPWEDPLMSVFFAYPFVLGLALAWVWDKVKGLVSGGIVSRATSFGLGYWVVASIPGMVITYSSFPVSLLMVITWSISGLVQAIVAGLIFAKLNA